MMSNDYSKFTNKAHNYALYRPSYAKSYLDFLQKEYAPTAQIADIGAGTGILTAQLLNNDFQVTAVEPNEEMAGVLQTDLRRFANFTFQNGTAENTHIPAATIDLITTAQAFHWFDALAFQAECRRILKPAGTVHLIWNRRDQKDPIIQELEQLNKAHCPGYQGLSNGIGDDSAKIHTFFGHENYEVLQFDNPLFYSLETFIGRNLSASYAPTENDSSYPAFVDALIKLFRRHETGGKLRLANQTVVYLGILDK